MEDFPGLSANLKGDFLLGDLGGDNDRLAAGLGFSDSVALRGLLLESRETFKPVFCGDLCSLKSRELFKFVF